MPMNFPDTIIDITEENNCPMYKLGDEFNVCGTALLMPPDKAVCLILVKDITDLFGTPGLGSKGQFRCSGCTGRVRLEYRRDLSFTLPPPRKSDAELATITGLLNRFEFFRSLEGDQVGEVVRLVRLKKYDAGEMIIRRGEYGRNFYIVASGKVEVLGNDRLRIALLKPGEVFGEMSLLSGDPTGADVRAVKPSGILYISARDFRQMLNKYAALQMYFTRLLTRRLTNINLARAEEFSSGMIGRLSEMPPSELFQTLNSNLKTGVLVLELREGTARVCFRDGEIIHARYRKLTDRDAFFQILRENRGRFKFMHGQCETHRDQEPIGDFMWLLMEGVNRIDEAE